MIKKIFTCTLFVLFSVNLALAQSKATFEELDPGSSGFWNGADGTGRFQSGNFIFHNAFNAEWSSWSGFAYTNHKDSVTAGWGNQYSSIAGGGVAGSRVYATAYVFGTTRMSLTEPDSILGMYITNNTYAYRSMLLGDDFTKKFGGADGADPDYFRLIMHGIDEDGDTTGTVIFYLADFRDDDNGKDYIVRDWTWTDLSVLGKIKSVHFSLQSTDMGMWGVNTPSYFCVDNVNWKEVLLSADKLTTHSEPITVFPNPFRNILNIALPEGIFVAELRDLQGRLVFSEKYSGNSVIAIQEMNRLTAGLYILKVYSNSEDLQVFKVFKQ
jgi:hypothetical protein